MREEEGAKTDRFHHEEAEDGAHKNDSYHKPMTSQHSTAHARHTNIILHPILNLTLSSKLAQHSRS